MPLAPRDVTIELTEGEYIAQRGTREVTWFIRQNDAWVHLSKWPAAHIERRQAAPGVVWESRTQLVVKAGARLMRVESRPAPPVKRDALEYLARPIAAARRVLRHEFRVSGRGQLERTP